MNDTSFDRVLQKYRLISVSERDKGYRFERLMRKSIILVIFSKSFTTNN